MRNDSAPSAPKTTPAALSIEDREILVLAFFVVGAAATRSSVFAIASGGLAVAWRFWRRVGSPILVGATISVLLISVSVLASRSQDGLSVRPGEWKGEAQVVTDPRLQNGQIKLTLRVGGKHLAATAPSHRARRLRSVEVGQWIWVEGNVRSLIEPVPGWMKSRHLAGRFSVREVGEAVRTPAVYRVVNSIRNSLLRSGSVLPDTQQPLFGGFLLGDDRGQSPAIAEDFQGSGLGHLLVVSGQNVAFTLAAFDPGLRRISRRWRLLATLAVLLLFAGVTRFEPSVLRASVMAAIAVWAKHAGRPQTGVRVLSLTVVVLVTVDPLLVYAVGFLLSATASLGILLWTEPITQWLPGPRWIAVPLATSIAAQAATSPIVLWIFGGVPTVTFLANLLALPAAEPIMAWGILAGLPAGVLGRNVSQFVHLPTRIALGWVSFVARTCSGLPLGEITVQVLMTSLLLISMGWLIWAGLGRSPTRVRSRASGATERVARQRTVGFLAVLMFTAIMSGVVQPAADGRFIAKGVQAWCARNVGISGHCQVVVLEHGAHPNNTLAALRKRRIRAIDLLVVRNGGLPQSAIVRSITERLKVGGVVVGERRIAAGFRPTVVVSPGTRLLAPPFRVHIPSTVGAKLNVVVGRR